MAIRLLLLPAELTNLPSKNEQYDGKMVLPHQRSELQIGVHGPVVTASRKGKPARCEGLVFKLFFNGIGDRTRLVQ